MNRYFNGKDVEMANKHVKWCSASLAIKGIQIKTWIRYSFNLLRESISRQVDKKSEVPKDEKGVWDFCFSLHFLAFSHKTFFFSLSLELMITQQTIQFKLCAKYYITTMYPWGQFLLPENLLANPVVLKGKLWEWV